MSLIPEKRVNKNGVAVTKHVRAAAKSPSAIKAPAPSLKPAQRATVTKRKPLTKKQLEQNYNSLIQAHCNVSPELSASLAVSHGKPKRNQIYVFTCSDAEVYEVISAAGLDNA